MDTGAGLPSDYRPGACQVTWSERLHLSVILFDHFEPLDLRGPLELFGGSGVLAA
jgi:hypothetical protein